MNAELASTNAVVSDFDAKSQAVQAFIMHHAADSHEWTLLPRGWQHLPAYLSLHGVMLLLSAALLVAFLAIVCRRIPAAPTGAYNLVEAFVKYIRDEIAIPFLGEKDGRRMTPLFCSFFFFILTMNLLGVVPCFVSPTSNVNVTGALAIVTFLFITGGGIARHGVVGFLKTFVPSGIPWPLLIILVPVEIVSVLIKSFALMIRLFANEVAGHIVIYSLLGLLLTFGSVALPAIALALGVYLLEVFVAFLQAYIFTLLSALFIGERLHPSH